MTWLRPVDRTSGTLTLSAGTLSCLIPSWNAPFEALPHDDRAGTHDSADGRCEAYASIGHGQAPTKICRRYPQGAACSPWNSGTSAARLVTGILGGRPNSEVPFWSALGACCSAGFWLG